MSTSSSFATLLARLAPLDSEVCAIEGHFATIDTRMHQSFAVSKCMKVGSYSRGTMIRGRSDGDLFVVLRREEVRHG
jgi:tRNA nucleotidyltransferase (CCA-adding enzyme)